MVRSWRPLHQRLQRMERKPKGSDKNRTFARFSVCGSADEPPMSLLCEVERAKAFVPISHILSRWNRFPTNYALPPFQRSCHSGRHARSALLAVIIPGCSLLTNHMLMLTAETGARWAMDGNRGALEMHMTDIRADLWPLLPAEVSAFTTGLWKLTGHEGPSLTPIGLSR